MQHDKLTNKFPRMNWHYNNGILYAHDFVNRKCFGNFDINFEQNATNGNVKVRIDNKNYPMLNKSEMEYKNFEEALEGIEAYFDEIAQKQKNISPAVELKAKEAYQKVIIDEIVKMV